MNLIKVIRNIHPIAHPREGEICGVFVRSKYSLFPICDIVMSHAIIFVIHIVYIYIIL